MPDKLDKYNIDDDLIGTGWEQMKNLLDVNMPQDKNKKRIIPFWWWLGSSAGIAAALLCGWFMLKPNSTPSQFHSEISTNSTTTNVTTPTMKTQNTLPFQEEKNNDQAINSIVSSKKTKVFDQNVTLHYQKEHSLNRAAQKSIIAENGTIAKHEIATPIAILANNPIEQPVVANTTKTPIILNNIPMLKSHLVYHAVDRNSPISAFETIKKPVSVSKSILHGITLRTNYFTAQQYAFSASYTLKKAFSFKNNIQARVGVEYQTFEIPLIIESYTIPTYALNHQTATGTPSNPDTTIYNVAYPYMTSNVAKDYATANNVPAKYDISSQDGIKTSYLCAGFELAYGYRCSRKLEVTAGLGYNYRFNKVVNNNNGSIEKAFGSSADKNSVVNFEYSSTDELQKNINKQDAYFNIGINYYFTQKFNIGLGLRKGFIDFSKNDPLSEKNTLNFGYLQSVFYF